MTGSDTAHQYWDKEWAVADDSSIWANAEQMVIAHAKGLAEKASVLDLGAGIGRHALTYARMGFAVSAVDAAPQSLAAIRKKAESDGLSIVAQQAMMNALPFANASFDHVLSWNVIYHADEAVLRETISEIERVLKPGGTFLGTMLSHRRLELEKAKAPGYEISRNTWIFEGEGDKIHPHYFCNTRDLVDLFASFEIRFLEDRPQEKGSLHWHMLAEKR